VSQLLLCHRRAAGVSRSAFAHHFRTRRRELIRAHLRPLGYTDYRQVHQTSDLNPLYRGIKLTRDPRLLALIPSTPIEFSGERRHAAEEAPGTSGVAGRHAAYRGANDASDHWDVVEQIGFESLEAMRVLDAASGRSAAGELVADQRRWASASAIIIADSLAGATSDRPLTHPTTTLFFLRARSPLSREAMLRHWANGHKQLFLSKQSALGYSAYMQLHVRSDPSLCGVPALWGDSGGAEFDGVACVTYGGVCRVALDFVSPRALWANLKLVCDEVTFIDSRRSTLVFGAELPG
jgi:hypothetical protein